MCALVEGGIYPWGIDYSCGLVDRQVDSLGSPLAIAVAWLNGRTELYSG